MKVGYGDIAPAPFTILERVVAIIWMIIGVMFFSLAISDVFVLLTRMNPRQTENRLK